MLQSINQNSCPQLAICEKYFRSAVSGTVFPFTPTCVRTVSLILQGVGIIMQILILNCGFFMNMKVCGPCFTPKNFAF